MKNTILILICICLLVGTVSADPVSLFTSNATQGSSPLSIQFTDESTGSPTGWAWFFGDEEYDEAWVEQNASSGWSPRYEFGIVALPDGNIVLMGGYTDPNSLNDTWLSTDQGVTWQLQNASSGWSARYYISSVALSDGSIVIMGGDSGGTIRYFNDTWLSTDQGVTWQLQNASSGWVARNAFTSVALPDDSIVLMGGYTETGSYNDTWLSTDQGVTWQLQNASSGWSERSDPETVALSDGSIVLMGGLSGTGGYHDLNDTWRSTNQGISWVRQTEDIGWESSTSYPSAVAMPDNSIVLRVAYTNITLRSTDQGITWTRLPDDPWLERGEQGLVALPDGSIVTLGGYDDHYVNETWRLQPVGSSARNPEHTYTADGVYNVSLQVYNSLTYNNTQKLGYMNVGDYPPVASFSSNKTSGISPLSIKFTDTSTGSPTSWAWFFGGQQWTLQNASSGWTAREYQTMVSLSDGSIVLMGGQWGTDLKNDTWRSIDKGATWQLQNASSGWTARRSPTSVALLDGSIVLMGGSSGSSYLNDTWRSTDQGVTWQLQNASPGWLSRGYTTGVALPNGHIVIIGGHTTIPYPNSYANDTWRSTDQGVTWQLQNASSGWSAREEPASVVLPDSSIVLIGGYQTLPPYNLNDTWRSTDEGVTWIRQTAGAEWAIRDYPSVVTLLDGSLILVGGYGSDYALNDTWRSTDNGTTWTELSPPLVYDEDGNVVSGGSGWAIRAGVSSVALPDGSLVMAGGWNDDDDLNDTWQFKLPDSILPDPVHTFTGVSGQKFNVSLQVYNSIGTNLTQKTDYITINPTPSITANFTATPTIETVYASIPFTDTSIGDHVDSWLWNFGDGGTSTLQNPTHAYAAEGTYTVNLTVYNSTAGYSTKVRTAYISITTSGGLVGLNTQDVIMSGVYTFTLNIKDAATLEPIATATVLDSLGTSTTTTNGIDIRSYGFQSIILYVSATGYESATVSYIIDRDRAETLYLAKSPGASPTSQQVQQLSYTAHLVRLRGVNYMGDPISDLRVSAVGVESSSSYEWISNILGLNLNETPLHNTTMSGTTGTDGAIVFLMVENIKYKINFVKTIDSINETMYLYPQDTNYEYVFWAETPVRSSGTIFPSFWNVTNLSDSSKMDLGIHYLDTGNTTDYLDFMVFDDNQTEIYRQRSTTPNNWTVSHPVTIARGVGYAWTIYANSTRFPNPIIQTNIIRFGGSPVIPFDLNTNKEDNWNQWIALSVIFLVALLFGRASIKYASAIIPLLALFFAVIGWLSFMPLMMSLILFIGIMFYMRYAEQEN